MKWPIVKYFNNKTVLFYICTSSFSFLINKTQFNSHYSSISVSTKTQKPYHIIYIKNTSDFPWCLNNFLAVLPQKLLQLKQYLQSVICFWLGVSVSTWTKSQRVGLGLGSSEWILFLSIYLTIILSYCHCCSDFWQVWYFQSKSESLLLVLGIYSKSYLSSWLGFLQKNTKYTS